MNGPAQSDAAASQLMHDIIALITVSPGALLRLPTSPWWGLALTRLGSAWWVAISIAGCARIAVHHRPWLHASARPDLGRLAAQLAAHFPHAEPREAPGAFLYALEESYGACGRAVILAQASAERYPWIAGGQAQVLPAVTAAAALDAVRAQEDGELAGPGAWAPDDLISGGALPAPPDPFGFLADLLARWDPNLATSADGCSRLRAALRMRCAQERQRLGVLRQAWPAERGENPYAEPPWLADGHDEQVIERALTGLGESVTAATTVALGGPQQPPGELAAARRRPQTLPPIQPPEPLPSVGPEPG